MTAYDKVKKKQVTKTCECDLILIKSYLFYAREEGKLKGLYQSVKGS